MSSFGKSSLTSSSRGSRLGKKESGTVQGKKNSNVENEHDEVNPNHNDESIQKKSTPSNDNTFQDNSKQKDQDFQNLQFEYAKLKEENELNKKFIESITNEIIKVNSLFNEPPKNKKKASSEDTLNMMKDIYYKISELKNINNQLKSENGKINNSQQIIIQEITDFYYSLNGKPSENNKYKQGKSQNSHHNENPTDMLKQIKSYVSNLQGENKKNNLLIENITKEMNKTNDCLSKVYKPKIKSYDSLWSMIKDVSSKVVDLRNDYLQRNSDYDELDKFQQAIINEIRNILSLFNKSNESNKYKSGNQYNAHTQYNRSQYNRTQYNHTQNNRTTTSDENPIDMLNQINSGIVDLKNENERLITGITKEINNTDKSLNEIYEHQSKTSGDLLSMMKDFCFKVTDLKNKYIEVDSNYNTIDKLQKRIIKGITDIGVLFKLNDANKYKQNPIDALEKIRGEVSSLQDDDTRNKQIIRKTTQNIDKICKKCTLQNKNKGNYQSNDPVSDNLNTIDNEINVLQNYVENIRSHIKKVHEKMNIIQRPDEENNFRSDCMLNLKLYTDTYQQIIAINANNNIFNKNTQAAKAAIDYINQNMKKSSQDQSKKNFENKLADLNPKLNAAISKLREINNNNIYLNSVISAFQNSINYTRKDMTSCEANNDSNLGDEYEILNDEYQESIEQLKQINKNNFRSNKRIKSLICCINHMHKNKLEYKETTEEEYNKEIRLLEIELNNTADHLKDMIRYNIDSNQMINDLKFCIYYIWSNKMTKDHVEESDFNQKMNEIGNLDTKIKLTYKWSPNQSKSQLSEIFKHIADSNKLIDDFEGCIEHIHKNMKEKEEKTNSTHNERLDDINKLEKTWKKNAPSKEYLIQIHKNNAYLNDAKFLMEEHIIDINNKLTEQYTNNLDIKNMKIKLNDLILQILLNVSKVIDNSDSSPYPQTSYINDEISHVSCVQDTIYDILNSLSEKLKDIFKNDGQELPPDVEKKDDEIESDQKLQEQYKSNNDSIIKLNKENQRLKKLTDNQKVIIRKQMILAKIENEEQIRQLREVQRKEIHNLIETMP